MGKIIVSLEHREEKEYYGFTDQEYFALAKNPLTPSEVLEFIIKHEVKQIRYTALKNPNISEKTLMSIVSNKNVDSDLIKEIALFSPLTVPVIQKIMKLHPHEYYSLVYNRALKIAGYNYLISLKNKKLLDAFEITYDNVPPVVLFNCSIIAPDDGVFQEKISKVIEQSFRSERNSLSYQKIFGFYGLEETVENLSFLQHFYRLGLTPKMVKEGNYCMLPVEILKNL